MGPLAEDLGREGASDLMGMLLDLKGALAKKAVEATCRSLIDRVMRSKVFPKGFGLKEKGERPDGDEHLRKRQKC